jgi:hypothetical protein
MNQNTNGSIRIHKTRNEGTAQYLVFAQLELEVGFSILALRLQGDSTLCRHTSRQGTMSLQGHQKSSLRNRLQLSAHHIDARQSSGFHDKAR